MRPRMRLHWRRNSKIKDAILIQQWIMCINLSVSSATVASASPLRALICSLHFHLSPLQDQSRTHEGQLDALEAEILKERGKLQKLQVKKLNAQLLRDACQVSWKLMVNDWWETHHQTELWSQGAPRRLFRSIKLSFKLNTDLCPLGKWTWMSTPC